MSACACFPDCSGVAEPTEHSPYMDDYCHDCTMHRCDAEGTHVVAAGTPEGEPDEPLD